MAMFSKSDLYDFKKKSAHPQVKGMAGLRALAAIGVFCVHFNQMAGLDAAKGPFDLSIFMANGNHGVALFFSLSGFLLSLPFWQTYVTGLPFPSLKNYFIRRAARIIPAYYVLLTLLILLGTLWKIPGSGFDILSHYLFFFNITEFSIFSINPPFWTIAVEVQFYFLLPFIFFGFRFFRSRHVLFILILMTVLSVWLQTQMAVKVFNLTIPWPGNPWLTWIRPNGAVVNHSIIACFPHFILGIIAGYLYTRYGLSIRSLKKKSEAVFWTCLTLITLMLSTAWTSPLELSVVPYSFPIIPILFTCMILSCAQAGIAGKILETPLLKWLGTVSYGLYLYHYPVLLHLEWQMRKKGIDAGEHYLFFGFTGFIVSAALAALSFYMIEHPLLRRAGGK